MQERSRECQPRSYGGSSRRRRRRTERRREQARLRPRDTFSVGADAYALPSPLSSIEQTLNGLLPFCYPNR